MTEDDLRDLRLFARREGPLTSGARCAWLSPTGRRCYEPSGHRTGHLTDERPESEHGPSSDEAELRMYRQEFPVLVERNRLLLETLGRVENLAREWTAAHESGGNGRHGYHATEYGDVYARDLRAVLAGSDDAGVSR